MIVASQAFKDAVKAGKPQRAMLKFADAVFTNEDISITSGGISFHDRFNESDELRMGACPENSLNVSLINRNGILNEYAFGRFTASIGALIEESTFPPSYVVQATYGQTTLYARTSKPYLLEDSGECSIQPEFPVKSIVIDDGLAFLLGDNGKIAAFELTATPHVFLANPEQYINNKFMQEKVASFVSARRGISKTGQYVTEWYPNGKSEKYEYVKLGEFVAQRPAIVRRRIVDLEASDYMQLFADKMAKDVTFSYPATLSGLVSQMCNILGVEWVQTDFINSSISVSEEPEDFKEATLQEILAWIAQAGCCYAKFNREGKLEMRWFNQTGRTFGETDYSDFTPYSYQVEKVDKLYVRNSNSTEERTVGKGGNAYLLQNNPFLRVDDEARTKSRVRARAASTPYDKIYDRLSGFEPFSPSTSELFTDWTTEAGDVVNVLSEGDTYSVPVYSMDMEWKGSPKVTLSNSGEQTRDTVSKLERQEYTSGKNDYALSRGLGGLNKKTDDIDTRLSKAELIIDEDGAQILLLTSRTDELGNRMTSAEIAIDGANAAINLKADATVVDGLGTRISSAEVSIDGLNAKVDLKAEKTTVDDIGKRVSSAEIAIDGANSKITQVAEVTDEQGNRISAAEIAIDGANSKITLKANKIDLDALITEVNGLKTGGVKATSLYTEKLVVTNGYVHIGEHDGSWKSIDVCTGVHYSTTNRYCKSPSDVTITIKEISGVWGDFETINFLGY